MVVESGYAKQGIPGASFDLYARSGIADRLVRAAQTLQTLKPEAQLLIDDAYRPKEVQQFLYDKFYGELKEKHPNWSSKALSRRTQEYVSIPSDDPLKPSPHITGGAIDLAIVENGKKLKFGTDWDAFGIKCHTNYFEGATGGVRLVYKMNRMLLYFCMTEAGFSNYPAEWWHFDFGNQFWSQVSGNRPAIYSVMQNPRPQSA